MSHVGIGQANIEPIRQSQATQEFVAITFLAGTAATTGPNNQRSDWVLTTLEEYLGFRK